MFKLKVPDMTCGGCETKVRKALAPVGGIETLSIDRREKLVSVAGSASEGAVITAIENVGFTVEKVAA